MFLLSYLVLTDSHENLKGGGGGGGGYRVHKICKSIKLLYCSEKSYILEFREQISTNKVQ